MTIREWQREIHAYAHAKGWWPDGHRPLGDVLTNIHSEIAEAWEEYRQGRPLTQIRLDPDGKPEGFPVELADAVIRILDLCEWLEIDLEPVIAQKMAFNQTRPHRHGGKLA